VPARPRRTGAVPVGCRPTPGEGNAINASPADQERLLALQAIDTAIDQLRHRRQNLPEQAELREAAAVHGQVAEELVAAETQVSDLELAVAKAESDLVPVRERRERDQRRIADGSVTDPKALASMVEEVDHLARRISDLEDIELEAMEELESATAIRDRLAARKAELTSRAQQGKARRDEALAAIYAELAGLTTDREAAAVVLPAALLATYDRSRAAHGGLGAVPLVQRRCGGCQLDINPADLRAYAAAPAEQLLRCEECGRILVRTAESGL